MPAGGTDVDADVEVALFGEARRGEDDGGSVGRRVPAWGKGVVRGEGRRKGKCGLLTAFVEQSCEAVGSVFLLEEGCDVASALESRVRFLG